MNRHGHTSLQLAVLAFLAALPLTHASAATNGKEVHSGHMRLASASRGDLRFLGKPDVKSSSVLVLDEKDSSVLYSRQADVALPIASITKLMTALVVLDAQQPLDEELEITKEDRDTERNSVSRLAFGTKLERGDLLHVALMASENRAAHALGRNYPGGITAFVHAMNAKAKALGMTSSHFVDPTGLSSDNVASPADLAKLVIAASHNPTIREYSTDPDYSVTVGRREIEFRNTNLLVKNPTWDIVVQKTGYITEAGKCLVMKAVIEGRSVVIVLLDSFGKYTRTADANRIRKWMESPRFAARTQ
jgi:D-alanyl-D-alanine endopeptidase (penicillin-binding protein 7)